MISKGMLLAIEGIDGAGKTTQAKLLQRTLSDLGYEAVYLKEPTEGAYGQQIKKIAMHGRHNTTPEKEHGLFLKDRAEDVRNNILPALNAKKIVIMDRYYISNMCYQSVLGLDAKRIKYDNEKFAPKPDLVIILDISPETGIKRIIEKRGEKNNHFEKKQYLTKVKAMFDDLAGSNIKRIVGTDSVEEVAASIQNIVLPVLRRLKKSGEDYRESNARICEIS